MSAPEVSVVIPTRDRWGFLSRHALPSALGQQDVELEVIVVDDASSDETANRLAEVADARVRVVRHDVPRRLPGARNAGAALASGSWLAFLDDDDVWSPVKLRRQIDAAQAGGRRWAYGRAVVTDAQLAVLDEDPFPAPRELPALLLEGNWIPGGGSNVVVRADLFLETGGFDEELRFFEDWDLWLRLLAVDAPEAVDEVVVGRVEHGANMVVRDRREVAAAHERLLAKHRTVTASDRRSVAEWLAFEQHRAGRGRSAARLYLSIALAHRSPGNLVAAAGALLGQRGMWAASEVLRRTRGASHLPVASAAAVVPPPAWLAGYGP
jgi:glycosyltransferase involved in cell wall biosynthesis